MLNLTSANIFKYFVCLVVVVLLIHAGYEGAEAGRRGRKRRGRKGKGGHKERRHRHSRRQRNDLEDVNTSRVDEHQNTYLDLYRRERLRLTPPLRPLISKPPFDAWTEAIVKVNSNIKDADNHILCHGTVGKFGYHSKVAQIKGKVVHVYDPPHKKSNLGCNYKMANMEEISTGEPWIALIRRGQCQFFHKIRLGELHNASAVVIYNTPNQKEDGEESIVMNTIGTEMVALMISHKAGKSIIRMLDKGADVYMDIQVGRVHNSTIESDEDELPTIPTSMPRVSNCPTSAGCRSAGLSKLSVFITLTLVAFRLLNER